MKNIYKIALCSILFLSSIASTDCSQDQSKALLERFKQELYLCQIPLMDEKDYYQFIDPYIQQAKVTLKAPEYCTLYSYDQTLIDHYFSCLIRYNVSAFKEINFGKKIHNENKINAKDTLKACLGDMRRAWNLDNFNIELELNKTTKLFDKANKAFYKKLSIKHKALIFINRNLNISKL